jgi:DNA repair protein RecO (recombination protein O)
MNSLEPFSLVNLCFRDRPQSSLVFIVASDLLRSFNQLTTSLEKITWASYMVEITDGLTGEGEENRLVFQHLRDGLGTLNERSTSLKFLTAFELTLLQLAGYQPLLNKCKRCGKERGVSLTNQWQFSPRDGGILCEPCSGWAKETLPLSAKALDVLTDLQARGNMPSSPLLLPSSVVREIRSIMQRFIQFHIDREIKSASVLNEFSMI